MCSIDAPISTYTRTFALSASLPLPPPLPLTLSLSVPPSPWLPLLARPPRGPFLFLGAAPRAAVPARGTAPGGGGIGSRRR